MIPEYLLAKIEKSDVIYRCIGNEMKNGILACGFMRKETADLLAVSFFERVLQLFRAAARERGIYCRGRHLLSATGGKSGPASAGCAAFHTRRPRWEMAGIFYLDWETVF